LLHFNQKHLKNKQMSLAAIGCKGILKTKDYGFSYTPNRITFLDRSYLPDIGLLARQIRVEANSAHGRRTDKKH